jgi:predicted unusual protein kinase regulating ubiquinone biosynthesis (AarF/ABC1/UbiB family)
MTSVWNNILFLIRVSLIILSEGFLYIIFKNKEKFIINISDKLAKINILYVKIFQAFALNNKLIDEKTNNYLLKYTDNAPWIHSDIDYITLFKISNEYNLKIENCFAPINSGMISLVFKAINNNTKQTIIIKIKRNNIEIILEEAIDNLLFFIYLLSYIPIIQKYEIPDSVSKNIEIIRTQTNFNKEIENMRTIKSNCKRLKYVVIPDVYKEVTYKYNNVIMMEFINGQKIGNVSKEDYYDFSILLHKFVFITLFINGVTHGDLHSGNILFIKDEENVKKIGLIDFGILYKTDKKFNETIFDFCTGIFTKSPQDVSLRILNNGFFEPPDIIDKIPKKDGEHLIKLISIFINDILHKSKEANQIKIYEFLFNLNNYVSENKLDSCGIKMSDEFLKLQMFLAMYQGIVLKLSDDDFMSTVNKVITELYGSTLTFFESD